MIYGREGMMALLLGVFFDLLIGDPHCFYHPIRLVGNLISVTEKGLRAVFPKTEQGEKTAGVFLSVIVCSVTAGAVAAVLYLAGKIHPYLHLAVMALFCYWMLAAKSLKDESMKVYRELKKEDLKAARRAVSMIVSRDTDQLTAEGVTKAAVETVAENASDGVMAPLLYLAVGGPVLGAFYKAVNTMDSMVGYKNEKYLYFGRFAAKVDDVLNYIPARLSALFMVAAAGLTGLSAKMPGRSSNETAITMPARIRHRRRQPWQGHSACSLPEMPGILELYIKRKRSEMHCVPWNVRISEGQTG